MNEMVVDVKEMELGMKINKVNIGLRDGDMKEVVVGCKRNGTWYED